MCCEEWGATHEETITLVNNRRHMFDIEVCGTDFGCGVILRDSARCPIIALSRGVFDDYISQVYFELQGVSLGLKLAMKYKIRHFDMICTSHGIAQYVMLTLRNKCYCPPPRDGPKNAAKNTYYCVECSRTRLNRIVERENTDKIERLMDEIFHDALECEDYVTFDLRATELSRLKAVCHLANSGVDQELRLPDIEEDEKLVEILYKDVYCHISNDEEMVLQQQQLMLKRQQREMVDIHNKEVYSYYESKKAMKLQK
ncbi:hypothetical protein MKW92_029842 [Papaver armeniacum]|nr:hypothetical protein MKW92_029842 [Papaver armeniacum]